MTKLTLIGENNFRVFKVDKCNCLDKSVGPWVVKNLRYYDTSKRDYVHILHFAKRVEAKVWSINKK